MSRKQFDIHISITSHGESKMEAREEVRRYLQRKNPELEYRFIYFAEDYEECDISRKEEE